MTVLVSPKDASILLTIGYVSTRGLLKPAISGHPGTHLIISKQAYYRLKVRFGYVLKKCSGRKNPRSSYVKSEIFGHFPETWSVYRSKNA